MENQNLLTNDAVVKTDDRQKKKRRVKRIIRRIILWLIILAILAAIGLYVFAGLKAEYTVNYQAYTVSTGTISNSLSFSGTLQLRYNDTYTASSQTSVRNVYVKAGDNVSEGDKLVRLTNGTVISSEIDGRVNQLNVAEGDSVSSGTTIAQVADFNHMYISIRIDEYDIGKVSVGDECRVTTTATEQTFDSTIADINYISSSTGNVAYYTATAYVDVGDNIYPGMQVTVTVPQEEAADAVILKEDALSFDSTNRVFVYTFDAEGNAVETYVETGISNGNYVVITKGLNSGDIVYKVAETTSGTSGGVSSLLGGIFGGSSVTGGGNSFPGGGSSFPGSSGSGSRDFSSGSSRNSSSGGFSMPNMGGGK